MKTVIKLMVLVMITSALVIASDDLKELHRLAERVAKAETLYDSAIKKFNRKAKAWESECRAEGKTPQIDGFSNPKCVFVPVPAPPPGTNK